MLRLVQFLDLKLHPPKSNSLPGALASVLPHGSGEDDERRPARNSIFGSQMVSWIYSTFEAPGVPLPFLQDLPHLFLGANLSKCAAAGVQIKNIIFSDLSRGQDFSWEVREVISDEPQMWRVGYYDQPRSWEDTGPDPGDQNSITRRFADQKQFPAARMPKPKPSFLEACSAKALSLQKAAAKKRRQLRQMRTAADTSPTESSSSSSSSSDDDSAASDSE